MEGYEEKVLKYCSEQVLPGGYKINDDLRRKLITLVEDAVANYCGLDTSFDEDLEIMREERVLPCIEDGIVGEWIYEACVNADYLTEEEKVFLLKSLLRQRIEDDRCMFDETGFFFIPEVPYQFCMSYLLEHEPLTQGNLLCLLKKDEVSPDDSFIRNFQVLLNDRNLSDLMKILYYFCLPRIATRRAFSRMLQRVTVILLNSELIAKENRVKVFELLRKPDTFMRIRMTTYEITSKASRLKDAQTHPFVNDLFQSLEGMPKEIKDEFLGDLSMVTDYDFNSVRRTVCDWYISQLPTLEVKKEAIVQLLEDVDCVKSDGDWYMKLSAYDTLYSMSEELGTNFVRRLLERGTHSNFYEIRAHCYKYLLLLFDDAAYVEGCLNDTSKKVRETVVRTALSGTEMDSSTRLRLSEIIKEKKLKLTKKQKGRLKNLLEQ